MFGSSRALTLAVACAATLALPATAQQFRVEPAHFYLEAEAGSSATAIARVYAPESDADVTVKLEPFVVDDEGQPQISRSAGDRDLIEWVRLRRQSGLIEMTIEVPATARGTFWAALVVGRPSAASQPGMRVTARMIVPVILTVTGTEEPRLEISEVRAARQGEEVAVSAVLHNRGNSLLRMPFVVTLERVTNGISEELSAVDQAPVRILPGTSRRIAVRLPAPQRLDDVIASIYAAYGSRPAERAIAHARVEPGPSR